MKFIQKDLFAVSLSKHLRVSNKEQKLILYREIG
jgi:hypothetical protein